MFPLSFKTSVGYGILLLWIIVLQSFLTISTACIDAERSSLLYFKGGLNLSSGRLSSWRGLNCCEWEGVGCDYHTSHVITLDLSNPSLFDLQHQLSGEIHPSLFDLQHLQHLDFSRNNFEGISIPPQVSKLQRLSFLSLSNAGFGGEVPLELGNMSSLRHLDLSDNYWEIKRSDKNWGFNYLNSNKFDVWARGHRSLEFLGMDLVNLTMDSERWGEALSGLHNLTQIHLSHCGLSGDMEGTMLHSFESHSSLAHLDLGYNHLTGQIPPSLCELSTLSELHLDHNQLSGTIPDSLLKMASLEVLSLASNRLRGNISLQMLDNLTCLRGLDLSENQLSITISASWIPQFDHLEYLALRSCNIEGAFPPFLSQQYQLRELDLSSNNLVGNIPSCLWDLPNIDTLILSDNKLEGSLPWQISHLFSAVDLQGNRLYGTLPTLDFVSFILDLSDNMFNGSIPKIRPPPDILGPIFLSLSGNNLSGEIPSSSCTNSDRVGILDLSNNKLMGMIPANIGSCSRLYVLNLAHNDLDGEIPEELGNLTGLRALNLNGNRFQGNIPPSLSNCTDLQIFDLGNNKFEGKIPVWIEKLKDLIILSLTSNNFEGKIPSQFVRLQNLRILDLSSNCLSESIPQDLSKLYAMINQSQSIDEQLNFPYFMGLNLGFHYESKFEDEVTIWIKGRVQTYQKIIYADKFMDLSHNNLSGNIPPGLGVLQGLISLNFSNNQLCGSIPESLVHMVCLESLDLSENKLSGKIPLEFSNLTFLEVLNLSNNMLSGLIPQGKQFATFEASSFLGNPNLHGFPLENMTLGCGLGCKEHQAKWNKSTVGTSKDIMESQWWAVGLGLSYGVGFGIVIAVLCFHIKWRYACFHLMDNFIYQLFEG